MEMLKIESSLEYKLQCLKWSIENDDVKRIAEHIKQSDDILSDPNVRGILPQLLCEAYSLHKIPVVLLLLDVLQKDVIHVRNDPRSWFQKVFCSAVESGHTALVTRMLQLGASVNISSFGKPLLHTAACQGYEDIMTELLSEGADVNSVDKRGDPVIHSVLKSQLNNKLSVTRLLLSYGADPLVKSMSGKLPIHIAVNNSQDVLELFLQDGQDVNTTESVNKDTPLHVACGMCCHGTILKLVQYGALINLENKHGETPLAKLLKHTNKANDFHSKTRIQLAKLLVSIGFRMKEKLPASRAGSSYKGRDKIFERYKEIKLSCNNVQSLQNISRIVVRGCLTAGVGVPKQINELDIPSNLKSFILCQELTSKLM